MARLQLIHWKESEGRARADELRSLGHSVQYECDGSAALTLLRRSPVDVVVIDLTHLTNHGRAAALALRQRSETRNTPLVLLGAQEPDLIRLRTELPDAVCGSWEGAGDAIEHALTHPPGQSAGTAGPTPRATP